MNYRNALHRSRIKRIVGFFIGILALISLVVSLLKFLYYRIDDGSKFGAIIAKPFKNAVSLIAENTQFLNVFWENSPVPNHLDISEPANIYFLFTYVILFVGLALKASGNKMSVRLAKIRDQIEDQLIKESLSGGGARSRQEIEDSIEVPNSNLFTQFQQLYFAPIITAIIAGVIIKLLVE
ncbi:YniB family protein [Pseudocolwellia sp. HL-MZ19]|uniref:YniB family protein n=1 Tax=Pseudocolwellia sp. HL-MZ19 TaxID=3400846 RepID=UPI003CF2D0BE